ncbi:MAG TPA: TonB-dependent receptor [Bacteroidota bacterium]|nr:TonB-dependent receptor [Bacteroidota bacterium]
MNFAQNEKEYTLDGVVVTGSRLPMGRTGARHTVAVMDLREIEQAPARSVEELLQNVAGIDVRQRGAFGVQADVGIRGGTFEQTLVMIDGVKMIDAQTGHHNFNIPLTGADIERIEVLKGPGSRQYGPNAFNGAINIITKKHDAQFARVDVMGGEHGLWEGLVSTGLPLGSLTNSVSFSKKKSDGYRENTDFDITTMNAAAGLVAGEAGSVNASVNVVDKKFGANGFYSTKFPNQFEHTKTFVALLEGKLAGASPVTFNTFYRRNSDYFILKRENPKFYENTHTTNSFGGEAQASLQSRLGLTAVGVDAAKDEIESTRLGSHDRTRASVFAEHQLALTSALTLEFGGSAQWYSDWKWNVSPGVDLGLVTSEHLRFYASVGKSFRVPTYTELYYSDPTTLGNATLKPEEAWTYEIGSVWSADQISLSAAVFHRRGFNLIDFVRASDSAPWAANNISVANTNGLDLGITLPLARITPLIEDLRLSYTYADIAFQTDGGTSRYVLDHLKHHAVATVALAYTEPLRHTITARYEERLGYTPKTLVDTRIGYRFASFELYGEVTNLFNESVIDIVGTPLAGRWARAGIALRFGRQ